MTSKSILLNGHKWRVKLLGENAILLENDATTHDAIHTTTALISAQNMGGIIEIVPAYASIAIVIDMLQTDVYQIIISLENITTASISISSNTKTHHINVDYEKGLDWQEIIKITGLTKSEIIRRHTAVEYRVEMMGFLPGFVYLSGMDEALYCPRKANPRVRIPAGAVGIGGAQTGIYALESPGGWQIIGQTDATLFDPKKIPPNTLNVGDSVQFVE